MTVSQLLRRIAGKFTRAKLHYGHGTHNAREEAAWLISSVLGFLLEQELDGKQENKILNLARRRIRERKPLAYLLREAWLGGLDERHRTPGRPKGDDAPSGGREPFIAPIARGSSGRRS